MKVLSLRRLIRSSIILFFLTLPLIAATNALLNNMLSIASASPTQYQLTVQVVGSGTTDPAPGNNTYDEDTDVPVDAIADSGWMLDHWMLDGGDVGSADPYTVTMDSNHTLKAVFVEIPTAIAVDPPTSTANPSEYLTINITIANVTDLYSWAFKLKWPTGLFSCNKDNITEGSFLATGGSTVFTKKAYTSYIDVGCSLLMAPEGVNGTGTLATVTFKVLKAGNCTLELYDTTLLNPVISGIMHRKEHGYFYTTRPVVSYKYSPHPQDAYGHPIVGETVIFNATTSYDPDQFYRGQTGVGITLYEWDFDGDLTYDYNNTDPYATHVYGTAGDYRVILRVTDDDGENSTVDQPIIGTTVRILLHDIAVINVTVSSTVVSVGATASINVTVLNEGSKQATENLNVTAYANMQPVKTKLFDYWVKPAGAWVQKFVLLPGENQTTTILWDTTGVPPGKYAISAKAFLVRQTGEVPPYKWVSVPGIEQDSYDNAMFYGVITLTGEEVHDLAVTNVKVDPTFIALNEWSYVRVTVENKGNVDEHYNATLTMYLNSSIVFTKSWSNKTLRAGETAILESSWFQATDTTKEGEHNVTAIVHLVNRTTLEPPSYEDANSTDNVFSREVDIYLKPVAAFTYSPTTLSVDETVTFNATQSYNPGLPEGTIKRYKWEFGDGTSVAKTSPTTTHVYRLSGNYTVKLTITDDSDKTNFVQKQIAIPSNMTHILMSITFSPSVAKPGESISVNVTVRNVGYSEETFNVTAYYDENKIGTETNMTLECGVNTTLTFTWDTTGVPQGFYTIKSVASKLTQAGLRENTYVGGTVALGIGGISPLTSNVTISATPSSLNIGASTTISGSISPVSAGARVVIQFRPREQETWSNLSMVITDQDGKYEYTWQPQKIGLFALKSILLDEDATLLGESGVEVTAVSEGEPPDIFFYTTVGLASAAALATVIMSMTVFYLMKAGKGKPK